MPSCRRRRARITAGSGSSSSLPDAPESRYLYAVLAGHDFQEGLKNYRDLVYLGHTLDHWSESMEALGDMIDTRERAYAERLPRADALLASGAADALQRRREELAGRLDSVVAEADIAALGSPEERASGRGSSASRRSLQPQRPASRRMNIASGCASLRACCSFVWIEAFKARAWQQRRAIKDLDLALVEAQNRWVRVQHARKIVPDQYR